MTVALNHHDQVAETHHLQGFVERLRRILGDPIADLCDGLQLVSTSGVFLFHSLISRFEGISLGVFSPNPFAEIILFKNIRIVIHYFHNGSFQA